MKLVTFFSLVVYFSSVVGMDSKLKGITLNHTLKSYKITPIESTNVLRVTIKFYRGFKIQEPHQEEEGQAEEGEIPGQV